jgi:hypothetical protein
LFARETVVLADLSEDLFGQVRTLFEQSFYCGEELSVPSMLLDGCGKKSRWSGEAMKVEG